jgi:predicted RNA polymerase sigma factor
LGEPSRLRKRASWLLDSLRSSRFPPDQTADYQPYWAACGHLLRLLNRSDEAREAFDRAASLTDDPALHEYLFQCSADI